MLVLIKEHNTSKHFQCDNIAGKSQQRGSKVFNLNPIVVVSFLWSGVEQKDLVESEIG